MFLAKKLEFSDFLHRLHDFCHKHIFDMRSCAQENMHNLHREQKNHSNFPFLDDWQPLVNFLHLCIFFPFSSNFQVFLLIIISRVIT